MAKSRLSPTFILIFLAFSFYASTFIYQSSFVYQGERIFCLFDDAMISMGYAKNLANGKGLKYSQNATPVEGFSNPLWTLMKSVVHLIPFTLSKTSLVVQIISLGILLANLWLAYLITKSLIPGSRDMFQVLPVALTASYYPLTHWALQGMETGLQALLVLLCMHITIKNDKHSREDFNFLALLIAGGLLLRMDMLFVMGSIVLLYIIKFKKIPFRDFVTFFAIIISINMPYFVFRIFYFHDFLPNTYYLKIFDIPLSVRVVRGGFYFCKFVAPIVVLLVALGCIRGYILRRWFCNSMMLVPVCVTWAYSIYVGGDAWENHGSLGNRFVIFAMPVLFIFLSVNFAQIFEIQSMNIIFRSRPLSTLLFFLFTAAVSNNVFFSEKAGDNLRRMLLLKDGLHFATHEEIFCAIKKLESHMVIGDSVTVLFAGIPAYFSDINFIDILGYTDREIARLKPRFSSWEDFIPGHVKYDVEHTVNRHKPTYIWGIKGISELEMLRLMYIPDSKGYYRRHARNYIFDDRLLEKRCIADTIEVSNISSKLDRIDVASFRYTLDTTAQACLHLTQVKTNTDDLLIQCQSASFAISSSYIAYENNQDAHVQDMSFILIEGDVEAEHIPLDIPGGKVMTIFNVRSFLGKDAVFVSKVAMKAGAKGHCLGRLSFLATEESSASSKRN